MNDTMDFSYLLEIAKQNREEAGKQATVKRYNTDLKPIKPAKKEVKGNVKSGAIKAFLARREEEERQKGIEAEKKKSELLSLRAQNTKNSKKAKLMVSRTKDNDYSKIKLTEEEEQLRKQREIELQRRMLTDKIERMKARIEMEEKEKLLPRKRKRKARPKTEDASEDSAPVKDTKNSSSDETDLIPAEPVAAEKKKKVPPPPQSSMNFHDLLKLASRKQHEPIPAPKVVKKEERPMTEKEKRIHEEQQLRKKGLSVYSLPQTQPTSKRKSKANSENNVNKKQISSCSSNGHTDSRQMKNLNSADSTVKPEYSSNKRDIQEQNSSKNFPSQSSKLKSSVPIKHQRYVDEEDEEEEYDDLDDFIDDGPVDEEIDISSQIREIFKYDSKRYVDDDTDDDDVVESSFTEQMKEECRSAKIGRMEDLEDMEKEEELRRQRLMKLKKKKNAR